MAFCCRHTDGTCFRFRDVPDEEIASRGSLVQLMCSGRDGEEGVWRREDGVPITKRAIFSPKSLTIPSVSLSY